LGEELAQGMQNLKAEIQTKNREVTAARKREDEARAELVAMKEQHRRQSLNPQQLEAENRARREAWEAKRQQLQAAAGELVAPVHPQTPQRPSRPRGMGR
jgi:predicted  nucleic acid-binding Zn-ribbon protein